MALERRAIEVETTPMPVTPATAAEMKHWVSQVEAAGSEAITGYMRMRGLEPPRPYGHTDLNHSKGSVVASKWLEQARSVSAGRRFGRMRGSIRYHCVTTIARLGGA
jgi:hypothetical protein